MSVVKKLKDGEILLDEDVYEQLKEMGEPFGETPEQVLKKVLRDKWEEFKKEGKIGEA
jgi:hypothetical protein